MLMEVSKITGIAIDQNNIDIMRKLHRIIAKIPTNFVQPSLTHPGFVKMVKNALKEVENEGEDTNFKIPGTTLEEDEDGNTVMKHITGVSKGTRIKVAASDGVRYSFGPTWNQSVLKGTGIAVHPNNRVKLICQAQHHGIENVDTLEPADICKLIAKFI
jgi:hypothetical protein